jgi:hypothetical protein
MTETLAQQNRAETEWQWNTQDFASTVSALLPVDRISGSRESVASPARG